jgi:osmotically-inducible protein OsmY
VVVQLAFWVGEAGQSQLLGPLLVAVVARELGPVLINLIVIVRSDSAMTTELGILKINGEVRALEAQGSDPFLQLVMPRVLGTVGKLITDPALADEAQDILARANETMSELQGVVTNLNVAAARLPEITDTVADEAKDLPGLVRQTQTSMRELERLIEALQRHWLVRKYVNQTNPPPPRPLSEAPEPEKKPVKSLHSPRNSANQGSGGISVRQTIPKMCGRVTPHSEGPARSVSCCSYQNINNATTKSKSTMKMKSTYTLALLAATSALLVTSASLRASDTDSRIESSAAKSYVFKTYLKNDSIKTESKDGVVTLTGTVAEASHKTLAENTVASLPGVKSVDNRLKIKGENPAEHSDSWISMKVKTALLFHRNVSASGTTVYVKNGIVTLQGEASSLAQKELTTEYAKDVDNVKEVKNEMTIAKTPAKPTETMSDKIDDASITAQVKSSLLSHHSTSALKTSVETTDGVVTLSGIAKNDAEKSLVTKLVTDINGVTSVINNMTVAVP